MLCTFPIGIGAIIHPSLVPCDYWQKGAGWSSHSPYRMPPVVGVVTDLWLTSLYSGSVSARPVPNTDHYGSSAGDHRR